LIRNDGRRNIRAPQPLEGGVRVRHRRNSQWVCVTGNVDDNGSVSVEKDSERLRHSAFRHEMRV
jgi:hypothetical protein